jgi:hypothetical protein
LVGKPELSIEENRNGWEFIRKADWYKMKLLMDKSNLRKTRYATV